METKFIIAGVSVVVLFLLYLFKRNKTTDNGFSKDYEELLNSSKYKVKGQYD